jgi:uncharacterized lipoprotein YehR (DUF1307 family)
MKKTMYLAMAIFIIIMNISITGCAILNHEKIYHQTVECRNGHPIVKTFYGTDTEYMKIQDMNVSEQTNNSKCNKR